MLSKKLFRLIHKIALFAIVFASLAPSISHAMEANSGAAFKQEICSANGKKISIQVTTSKGQQFTTEFSSSTGFSSNQEKPIKNISMHLEHCPFCSSGVAAVMLPTGNLTIFALLEISAQKAAEYAAPVVVSRTYESPQSQAPPRFSVV